MRLTLVFATSVAAMTHSTNNCPPVGVSNIRSPEITWLLALTVAGLGADVQ